MTHYLRLNDRDTHRGIAWVGPFTSADEASDYTHHSADDYIVVDEHNQPDRRVAEEVALSDGIMDDSAFEEWLTRLFPTLDVCSLAVPPN